MKRHCKNPDKRRLLKSEEATGKSPGGTDQGGSSGDGEKWVDFENVWKVESGEFSGSLDVVVREGGTSGY